MQRIINAIQPGQALESKVIPPVHKWNPTKVVPNDMRIDSEGRWFHEGDEINRLPLCQLFASILRKDDDEYFLVTPTEKFPIVVDDVPFLLAAVFKNNDCLVFLNTLDEPLELNAEHKLELRDYKGVQVPYIHVRDDLYGRVSRNCFYNLVETAQSIEKDGKTVYLIKSGEKFYNIGEHSV